MDIGGWVIGGVGIVVSVIGILDARGQRSKVERLATLQAKTIENMRGFLHGVKGWHVVNTQQIDNQLQYIKERDDDFQKIVKGEK